MERPEEDQVEEQSSEPSQPEPESKPDWELDAPYQFEDERSFEGSDWTLRQVVIRVAAVLLLLAVVGSFILPLRGIKDILLVIGLLLTIAFVAKLAKEQKRAENPYHSKHRKEIR